MEKNKQRRFEFVDILRGLAMVAMIFLHTNAYFLHNPIASFTWDWGQFAVPVFVFCSAYLFFKKNGGFGGVEEFGGYIKKRLWRLLTPYYVFVAVFCGLIYLKEPTKLTGKYIFQNLTLIGGIDINWLVLLFVYFVFIMPFVRWGIEKRKLLFYSYIAISIILSFFLILNSRFLILDYRFTMWLPWSLLIVADYFITKYENNNKILLKIFSLSGVVFIMLFFLQKSLSHSTVQYYNKYPPNLYHITFCVASTILVYWLVKIKTFSFFPIKQLLVFLSKNSYTIYFIHYCIIFFLFVFTKIKFNWMMFFLTVLCLSTVVQFVLNRLLKLVSNFIRSRS